MITTLLKHEWLRTRGPLATVGGLAVLATGLGSALAATGWPILSILGAVVGVVAAIALAPVLQLMLTADFWRSSYSRTGYFTHSLPIRGSRIYLAKLIWALVVTVAGLLITAPLLGIVWAGIAGLLGQERNPLTMARALWESLTAVAPPGLIAVGALLWLGAYLIWPVQYYFAVSLGHENRLNRLGFAGPVVVFVGLYFAMQVIALTGMLAIPYGLGLTDDGLGVVPFGLIAEMAQSTDSEVMPLGFIPAMALVAVACLWRTTYSWDRKIALT